MTGTGGLRRVPKNVFAEFQIPLPPLAIQEEIVAEIEGYQEEIENYKLKINSLEQDIKSAIDKVWGKEKN